MIYFNFNGLQSNKLIVTPVAWTEIPTADDPRIVDVVLTVTGRAFFSTSGETIAALTELQAWCAIESGSFAILYQNDDGNVYPTAIRIMANECSEPPTITDFNVSGDEFSFSVIAKRLLPARMNGRIVVSRDLDYSVSVTGGTGTTHQKLNSGGTSFTITETGTIGIDGNFNEHPSFDAFRGLLATREPLVRVELLVDPFTLHLTSMFSTNTTSRSRTRFTVEPEGEPP